MESQATTRSPRGARDARADNRADVVRVLAALGLLALLASFDGAGDERPAAERQPTATPTP